MKSAILAACLGLTLVGCAEFFGSLSKPTGPGLTAIQIWKSYTFGRQDLFGQRDNVVAAVQVSRNDGNATVYWRLFAQNVQGVNANAEFTDWVGNVDVYGNQSSRYTFKVPKRGWWRPGVYMIQADLYANGVRTAYRTATFTVQQQR